MPSKRKKPENPLSTIKRLQSQNTTLRRQVSRYEKEIYAFDALVTRVKTYVQAFDPPKILYRPTTKRKSFTKQSAVLLFSDCQLGERFTFEETGLEKYDISVFRERCDYLFKKTCLITDMHRTAVPIDDLHIFMLGDIVENETIFRGQGAYIEEGVLDQFFHGVEIVGNFVRSISQYFKNIYVSCVSGNHGRIEGVGKFYCNWDFLFYRFLETALTQCKNVKFKIPKAWWVIQEVEGHKFYLNHGDNLIRYMGVPWYSLERMDGRLAKMLQASELAYDYIVIGHHHQAFEWDGSHGERICNGSFSSGNVFAARQLSLKTRPTQCLFGVHPDRGITWRYKVRLDEKE